MHANSIKESAYVRRRNKNMEIKYTDFFTPHDPIETQINERALEPVFPPAGRKQLHGAKFISWYI